MTAAPFRKIRVLIVTDEMEVGGTQRQIVHMVLGLDRAVFEPTVLYFRNESFFVDQLDEAGIDVVRIDKRARIDAGFVRRLRTEVSQGDYDVMHCFALTGELWGAVVHALLPSARRPVLLTSIRNTYDWERPLHRAIKAWVMRRSWRVVANTRAGAASAHRHMRLPDSLVHVIYNGVAAPRATMADAAAVRAELGVAADAPLALFVGRLVEQKDVATLIRAMQQLAPQAPHLAIAGDGPLRADLEALVAQGPALPVHFLGQRDDVPALIAAADMVVLPSRSEGLSNVVLESMMTGRPVVATRVGGNVELVDHERTGLLFDTGDVTTLAASIARLCSDPALRDALGRAARDKAHAEFSIPAMVTAFSDLYREAAALRMRQNGTQPSLLEPHVRTPR